MSRLHDEALRDVPATFGRTVQRLKLASALHGLLCVPSSYMDCSVVYDDLFAACDQQGFVCLKIRLAGDPNNPEQVDLRGYGSSWKEPLKHPWQRKCLRQKLRVIDRNGNSGQLALFGTPWAWKDAVPDTTMYVYAQVTQWNQEISIGKAVFLDQAQAGRVAPVYTGIPGQVSGASVRQLVEFLFEPEHLELALQAASELIEQECAMDDGQIMALVDCANLERLSLRDLCQSRQLRLDDLLYQLHRPDTLAHGLAARYCANRICALALQVQAMIQNERPEHPLSAIAEPAQMRELTLRALACIEQSSGFACTANQRDVALNVANDLCGPAPLCGLLSGEVGAGKTVAYLAPAVAAHWAGAKVVVTAPTLLLADQIAGELITMFGQSVQVQRVEEGGKIHNDQAILVGTESLGSVCARQNYQANVVIFDEQHKIHTGLKNQLIGPFTHRLEVSATPIGRSLALSMYAGMRTYTLNQQPVAKSISTMLVDTSDRRATVAAIARAIANGKRAAVILPRVQLQQNSGLSEASGGGDGAEEPTQTVANAMRTFELFDAAFPGKVGLLHGSLDNPTKRKVLDLFRKNVTPILISTTVMETGISVPDISVIVIRNPERFGAFQLHQLRGRLARQGGQADCFLFADDLKSLSEDTLTRLRSVESTNDGYELAVLDMINRGAGEFSGRDQSGATTTVFKLINWSMTDWLLDENARFDLSFTRNDEVHPQPEARTRNAGQVALF